MPVTLKTEDRLTGTVPDRTGVTDNEVAMECGRLPDTPDIVTADVAGGVELPAESVSTLVPIVVAGSNAAVTPCGSPVAVRSTVPLKLPRGITRILLVAVLPCGREADGNAE